MVEKFPAPEMTFNQHLPARQIVRGGFPLFVFGTGWSSVLQCCHPQSLLLRSVYLSMFVFPFESLSCQLHPSHQPYSAVSPFLFCMALFYVGFYSFLSGFLRSLSWGYTSMLCASWVLDHRQLNCWEEGYRYDRLFWKKTIEIILWKAISFTVRSCCCEGAESNNTHLIK